MARASAVSTALILLSPRSLFLELAELGGPGSGKGRQCVKMREKYGFTHLSTGALLQNEANGKTKRGKKVKKIMVEGGLVPLGIMLDVLKDAMLQNLNETKGFRIDGYPQTLEQAEIFDESITPPSIILLIHCSPEVMMNHRRFDDNEVTIRKPVETFFVDFVPIVKHSQRKGPLWTIHGEATEEDVFQSIISIINDL
ncbi:adenylate kinase isoenzyme 1-like [Hemitrygon akajei]|uniref:adenylate kinase isoenzyme 1-like n=1 Tax=Hemitrygon akajei TaxID=2704970 RepID=UPI003BF98544